MDGGDVSRTVVLAEADVAASALAPVRRRILAALGEPDSATGLARLLDLPRQKVNYHLRVLESLGLVELVEERPRRGRVERILRRTSSEVVLDPGLVETAGAARDGLAAADRFSAAAVVAAAADAIRAVGRLMNSAGRTDGSPVPTATAVADLCFARPADLRAFADEFGALCARYDRPNDPAGRGFRVTLLAHPHQPDPTRPRRTEPGDQP